MKFISIYYCLIALICLLPLMTMAHAGGHHHDHDHHDHHHHHHHHHHHNHNHDNETISASFTSTNNINSSSSSQLSPTLVWVAAMTTQFIMMIIAALGILLIPLLTNRPNLNRHVMIFLIAMSAGTLLGDAIIHLIPHSVIPHELLHIQDYMEPINNPHSTTNNNNNIVGTDYPPKPGCILHGNHWDCPNNETIMVGDTNDPIMLAINQLKDISFSHTSIIWTTLLVVLGAYLFYLVELILHSRGHSHHHQHDDHGHQHVSHLTHTHTHNNNNNNNNNNQHQRSSSDIIISPTPTNPTNEPKPTTTYHNGINMNENEFNVHTVKPVAWLIIVGDSVHNFFDGLAVGISFASSWSTGMTTAIAVLLHELPHELGDYAVMLESGIPKYRAALFNMVSNVTAFIGAAVGILMYKAMPESGQSYVLAITAGGFIYIALADLMPLLFNMTFNHHSSTNDEDHKHHHHHHQHKHHSIVEVADTKKHNNDTNECNNDSHSIDSSNDIPTVHIQVESSIPYSLIIAQNIGFLLGVGVMVYVAIYHDEH